MTPTSTHPVDVDRQHAGAAPDSTPMPSGPAAAPGTQALTETLIEAVDRITRRLDACTPPELAGLPILVIQGLKLAEETGELAAAVIGLTGANPRKGITHIVDDVAAEAVDVVVTALVFAERANPGWGARVLRLWQGRPARRGRDFVSVIEGTSAILDRRIDPDLTGPAALAFRALRVQAAAGAVAEAITGLLEHGEAGAWRDHDQWDTAIGEALDAVADALVVVQAVHPGQLATIVTTRLAHLVQRTEHFTTSSAIGR